MIREYSLLLPRYYLQVCNRLEIHLLREGESNTSYAQILCQWCLVYNIAKVMLTKHQKTETRKAQIKTGCFYIIQEIDIESVKKKCFFCSRSWGKAYHEVELDH